MSIVETLKRSELFLGLDDNDIQKIVDLPSCQATSYEAQATIFELGDAAVNLYVLEEGQINLVVKLYDDSAKASKPTIVRTITKGGIFGWAALVPPNVRIMSAITKEPAKLIAINGNELRILFQKEPKLGYEVMNGLIKVIGSRVWNIEQLLTTGRRSSFI